MKKVLTGLFLASFATMPLAAAVTCNGPVIASPKVVEIFWGPGFANPAAPESTYAQHLVDYRDGLGSTHVWGVLAQYGVLASNLGSGTPDWFDTSTPPTNVTDNDVQSEVKAYLANNAFDASTVYEVFLPKSSYSSVGSSTSCGGPSLAYCAYFSSFARNGSNVNYTVQPYQSCSGCQVSGWTAAQNEERQVEDATVDIVTLNCHDASGVGIVDKCGSLNFLQNGFGYVELWSNSAKACSQ